MRRRALVMAVVMALLVLLVVGWLLFPVGPPRSPDVPAPPQVTVAPSGSRGAPAAAPTTGPGEVECELSERVPEELVIGVEEVDPESLAPLSVLSVVRDDTWIRFRPTHADGLGHVQIRGYEPASLAWLDGGCLSLVALARRPHETRTGSLTGNIETGAVSVSARCGAGAADPDVDVPVEAWSAAVGKDGGFSLEMPTDRGPCAVQVYRVFGGRDLRGPWIAVTDDLALEVPTPGGVGLGLLENDDGMRVVGVEPGMMAARAGLQLGDELVSVDGQPAAELDADDLVEATGPLRVEFVRDGVRYTVGIERETP